MSRPEEQGCARTCPICGEELRLAWMAGDPPEPYGEVCGCPETLEGLAWARQEKAADDMADYYMPDESGYSRADEEWFFDADGRP